MTENTDTRIKRARRGVDLTLEQFRTMYALSEDEAARIFKRAGPSSVDLQSVMRAKLARTSEGK